MNERARRARHPGEMINWQRHATQVASLPRRRAGPAFRRASAAVRPPFAVRRAGAAAFVKRAQSCLFLFSSASCAAKGPSA